MILFWLGPPPAFFTQLTIFSHFYAVVRLSTFVVCNIFSEARTIVTGHNKRKWPLCDSANFTAKLWRWSSWSVGSWIKKRPKKEFFISQYQHLVKSYKIKIKMFFPIPPFYNHDMKMLDILLPVSVLFWCMLWLQNDGGRPKQNVLISSFLMHFTDCQSQSLVLNWFTLCQLW